VTGIDPGHREKQSGPAGGTFGPTEQAGPTTAGPVRGSLPDASWWLSLRTTNPVSPHDAPTVTWIRPPGATWGCWGVRAVAGVHLLADGSPPLRTACTGQAGTANEDALRSSRSVTVLMSPELKTMQRMRGKSCLAGTDGHRAAVYTRRCERLPIC
jgi:hypothetical protein